MVLTQKQTGDQWKRKEDPGRRWHDYSHLILDNIAKGTHGKQPLQQVVLRKLDMYMQMNETRFSSPILHKNQLQMNQRSQC